MRILMLGASPHTRGGIATVMRLYQNHWDHTSHQIKFVATYTDALTNPLLRIIYFLRAIITLSYYLLIFKPEITHIHFSKKGSILRKGICLLLARATTTTTILHAHASQFMAFYEHQKPIIQAIIRWILQQAHALIVITPDHLAYYQILCPNLSIHYLPNPIEIPKKRAASGQTAHSCLFLGRLRQDKGLHDLVEAVPDIVDKIPDIKIIIAGDGLQIPCDYPQVQYIGWIEGDEKEKWLYRSDILIQPSHNEAMPLSVMEAMSHALAIVASDVGGLKMMLTNGQDALLIPPQHPPAIAEAVVRIAKDDELYQNLRTAAYERVKAWDITVIIPQLYHIYETVRIHHVR